jgi:hypothetical protein
MLSVLSLSVSVSVAMPVPISMSPVVVYRLLALQLNLVNIVEGMR